MSPLFHTELLPNDIRSAIPKLYDQEHHCDPIVHLKFFAPMTHWTWYATEFDGEDIFFGWVHGDYPELGYFSLSELESILIGGLLPIERDLNFKPTKLSEVMFSHGITPLTLKKG